MSNLEEEVKNKRKLGQIDDDLEPKIKKIRRIQSESIEKTAQSFICASQSLLKIVNGADKNGLGQFVELVDKHHGNKIFNQIGVKFFKFNFYKTKALSNGNLLDGNDPMLIFLEDLETLKIFLD